MRLPSNAYIQNNESGVQTNVVTVERDSAVIELNKCCSIKQMLLLAESRLCLKIVLHPELGTHILT